MRLIRPGSSSYGNYDDSRRPGLVRTYFAPFLEVIRSHGVRGLVALVVAAVLAFAPEGLLVWFNHFRFSPVVVLQPGQTLIVRPERHEQQQRDDQVGGTSLLEISCEVPGNSGPLPLLSDDDPARDRSFLNDSRFVRNEQAYLRRAGDPLLPFGLLGRPPVSAWLPPGEYEVLIVYDAPVGLDDSEKGPRGFPLMTAAATCTTENREKTVCRVLLPHYPRSHVERIRTIGADGADLERRLESADLRPLLDGIERMVAIPTPAGYLLEVPEPAVRHDDEHRYCTFEYAAFAGLPREWTRDQLATLLRWLPGDDQSGPAREKLTKLVDSIGWRDAFRGWYLYAAAGVAGLVFTRWGATAVLEPWRRKETFFESFKTMIAIFLFSGGMWLLWTILTDGGGCRGPVPFRIR